MANTVISTLMANACPSIRYRLRREVLGQSPQDPEMIALQVPISNDPAVERVLSWQQSEQDRRSAASCAYDLTFRSLLIRTGEGSPQIEISSISPPSPPEFRSSP